MCSLQPNKSYRQEKLSKEEGDKLAWPLGSPVWLLTFVSPLPTGALTA